MPYSTVDLTPRIGTEVKADLATLLDGSVAKEVRALLEARGVLIFRGLEISDEQQMQFGATLGTIRQEHGDSVIRISANPEISPIFAEYTQGTYFFHIDGTYTDMPALASILRARVVAPKGGQTEFCNTYAAWDELPEAEKQALATLKVVHMFETAQRCVTPEPGYEELKKWQQYQPNTLPLVWTHRTGRKSLVLGSTASHIEGMDLREGWALLTRLREWATRPEFVYRHEWKLGDLVIWDNTGTMHRALPYPLDSGRLMYRTQIAGDEPFA